MKTIRPQDISEQINLDITNDLNSRLTRERLKKAEVRVLEKMDQIKNRETLKGDSPAKGGRWNNVYNREYARRKKGGRRSPVTLRQNKKRIEQTQILPGKSGSKLAFRDGKAGQIFFYHDSGTARGGKYRQVYPDSDNQVPNELDVIAENEVFRILNE